MTTSIATCAATACAFHQDGCTAPAITVGATGSCATFAQLDIRAVAADSPQGVGVCHRVDCAHNDSLTCTAESVTIADAATCGSYAAR